MKGAWIIKMSVSVVFATKLLSFKLSDHFLNLSVMIFTVRSRCFIQSSIILFSSLCHVLELDLHIPVLEIFSELYPNPPILWIVATSIVSVVIFVSRKLDRQE